MYQNCRCIFSSEKYVIRKQEKVCATMVKETFLEFESIFVENWS